LTNTASCKDALAGAGRAAGTVTAVGAGAVGDTAEGAAEGVARRAVRAEVFRDVFRNVFRDVFCSY
jgi:hypothetical protein